MRDHRGGGRTSGRETAARVAAGAGAKKILSLHNIHIYGYTKSVGPISAKTIDLSVIEKNLVRAPDLEAAEMMIKEIEKVRNDGDSIGGVVEAVIKGCPAGLGDPVFDKLNAKLAHALISIGAIKAIEFGEGFNVAKMRGSENNDIFYSQNGKIHTKTNHGGGILGGMSTGEDIILRVAVKPPSSIAKKQETVTINGDPASVEVKGRHDPCLCPRIVPVVEAMIAIVLVDCLLIQKNIR
jgi:chorismate synthase